MSRKLCRTIPTSCNGFCGQCLPLETLMVRVLVAV